MKLRLAKPTIAKQTKKTKSNPYHVDNVATSLLSETIEIFVERDNDDYEEEPCKELETINLMSCQVANKLSC